MELTKYGSSPFIPGQLPKEPELLARYFPPIPEGVITSWLISNVPRGSWVLDPFGASPRIAIETARAGYKVLVAANNPIARFLLEIAAIPPRQEDLKSALSELASSFVGDERIEPHIRSLYNTICARCGQTISAEAFLWEHDNPTPYARIYTCPFCGDTGEHPCTTFDASQAAKFSSSGLHKARALERVVSYNDQDRIHVEQALSVYNPRALYALITLINKLQGLSISQEGKKCLGALLIYSFDQVNSMWRPLGQIERRRNLTIPRNSREANVWCALEDGLNSWSASLAPVFNTSVEVATWPNLPQSSAGICIFEGRLVNLVDSIKDVEFAAICSAIPRPNQAFWTLSALWTGWLWGRDAVGTFKSVLHRQRYDWAWHANALASVFKQLANSLPPSTDIFGLIGEAEPGFIGSALVAAGVAGCRLENIALRREDKLAQILWKSEKGHEISRLNIIPTMTAMQAARQYLADRGEPASYLNTFSAALSSIVQRWHPGTEAPDMENLESTSAPGETQQSVSQNEPAPSVIYSNTINSSREALSYQSGFARFTLLEETNVEATTGNLAAQSSYFSDDVGKTIELDDENLAVEVSTAESELSASKERSTRSSDVPESTYLWLREPADVNHVTCSDLYEQRMENILATQPSLTLSEIDRAMCDAFPGLYTPDSSFIRICLDSYGLPDPQDADRWRLRSEDRKSDRQADLILIKDLIHQIGNRLQFDTTERKNSLSIPYIIWNDKSSGLEYWFFITSSTAIGEIVIHGDQPPTKGYILFPASRANLFIYKLRYDPRLTKAFNPSQGAWHFLKFRHVRSLAKSMLLNRDNLDQMLSLDPLTFTAPQLWLI